MWLYSFQVFRKRAKCRCSIWRIRKRSLQDYHTRIEAVKDFRKNYPKSHYRNTKKRLKDDYERLNFIRNALAHGTEPDTSITDLMQNPLKLKEELQRLFNKLGI